MPKLTVILMTSIVISLTACVGLTHHDFRQVQSVLSLNNHVSIKRQRQFVISPASHIALQITSISSSQKNSAADQGDKKAILNGLKPYFRQVVLFNEGDFIDNKFDFIITVDRLRSVKQMNKKPSETPTNYKQVVPNADVKVVGAKVVEAKIGVVNNNSTKEVKKAEPVLKKKKKSRFTASFKKPSIAPLQVLIKLSLMDARSQRILDVALVDSFSSAIRKPTYDDFLMDSIKAYANRISYL